MKYKIIKETSKTLMESYDYENDKPIFDVKISSWYEARRKGCIFGFWHKVGHKCDYEGNIIAYTTETVEDMEDYIRKWHDAEYSDYSIEIIKEIKI